MSLSPSPVVAEDLRLQRAKPPLHPVPHAEGNMLPLQAYQGPKDTTGPYRKQGPVHAFNALSAYMHLGRTSSCWPLRLVPRIYVYGRPYEYLPFLFAPSRVAHPLALRMSPTFYPFPHHGLTYFNTYPYSSGEVERTRIDPL